MARGSSRSRHVHRFPTTVPGKFIEIKVAYDDGGISSTSSRAYYMHVTPVEIEDAGNGVQFKKFMLFSGYKSRLEEAKRFSEKKLNELADRARRDCETQDLAVMQVVNRVLEQEDLKLQEVAAT